MSHERAEIFYREDGSGDTTLILLHGVLETSETMKEMHNILSRKYRVISMDIRGHGRTPNPEDFLNLGIMSEDVAGFVEEKDISAPVILGYSLGGYIGMYIASRLNADLSGLICHEVKFDWTPGFAEKMSRLFDPERIERKNPEYAEKLSKMHIHGWKKLSREVMEFIRNMPEEKLRENDFRKIDCPVMVSAGDQSELVKPEEVLMVCNAVENSCMCIMPFARHPLRTIPMEIYPMLIEKFIQKL